MNGSVVVAISAFRSDQAVVKLLEQIISDPHPDVVSIVVVDSLGSGKLPGQFSSLNWPVAYKNSDCNLGSAGNLFERISYAADARADWCFCLNHDANWEAARLEKMLKVARSNYNVGAVYPVLHYGNRERPWEAGRNRFVPSASKRFAEKPDRELAAEVMWSSSNGALYATAPYHQGVEVMKQLWMGYEDLAYGIALFQAGWLQLVCNDAVLSDIFDLLERKFLGKSFYIHDKPAWYSYYGMRNLLLIRAKYGAGGVGYPVIIKKFFHSALRIVLLENKKSEKLLELFRGFLHGFFKINGKHIKP